MRKILAGIGIAAAAAGAATGLACGGGSQSNIIHSPDQPAPGAHQQYGSLTLQESGTTYQDSNKTVTLPDGKTVSVPVVTWSGALGGDIAYKSVFLHSANGFTKVTVSGGVLTVTGIPGYVNLYFQDLNLPLNQQPVKVDPSQIDH